MVSTRKPRLATYKAIYAAVREEWDNFEPDDYAELILSMPSRVEAILRRTGVIPSIRDAGYSS
jgi:hypothetical protein